jgi:hypothetical protein
MTFKKIPNGEFYYFNKDGITEMIVRNSGSTAGGYISTQSNFMTPKELIGKKVRIKLEIVPPKN